ncbi:MAG: hypothetical protein EBZ77_01110 [Chitinophagia bacterium]|nr:hypothetical protein [Chitinophagia bacterium]
MSIELMNGCIPSFIYNVNTGWNTFTFMEGTSNKYEVTLSPGFYTVSTFLTELQTRLASENYRGMLGKSPKTLKHIQSGEYEAAAKEYLNARDYRENMENSVGTRMLDLSDALNAEAKRIREAQKQQVNTGV